MSDTRVGPGAIWQPRFAAVAAELESDVADIQRITGMSNDQARTLLFSFMPADWYHPFREENYWSHPYEWLGIESGDTKGPGAGEGWVTWKPADSGMFDLTRSGDASAAQDMLHSFDVLYNLHRTQPLQQAYGAALVAAQMRAQTAATASAQAAAQALAQKKAAQAVAYTKASQTATDLGNKQRVLYAVACGAALFALWALWPALSKKR